MFWGEMSKPFSYIFQLRNSLFFLSSSCHLCFFTLWDVRRYTLLPRIKGHGDFKFFLFTYLSEHIKVCNSINPEKSSQFFYMCTFEEDWVVPLDLSSTISLHAIARCIRKIWLAVFSGLTTNPCYRGHFSFSVRSKCTFLLLLIFLLIRTLPSS